MTIHIFILTSSDVHKAIRCLRSALMQKTFFSAVEVTVIVNSTVGYYYDDVLKRVREEDEFVKVINTPSNGKPGKGKNEMIKYAREHTEDDYYMFVDGDDFYYPTAVMLLLPLMYEGIEFIGGQSMDVWVNGQITSSWYDEQPNNAVTINRDIINGHDYDLMKTDTIDRPYAIARSLLTRMPLMPEDMDVCEDFVFCTELVAMQTKGELSYVMVNSSYIYGHDVGGVSQCTIYQSDPRLARWNIDKYWERVDRLKPILFSKTPFRELSKPFGFGIEDKYKFYMLINKNEAYSRTEQRH